MPDAMAAPLSELSASRNLLLLSFAMARARHTRTCEPGLRYPRPRSRPQVLCAPAAIYAILAHRLRTPDIVAVRCYSCPAGELAFSSRCQATPAPAATKIHGREGAVACTHQRRPVAASALLCGQPVPPGRPQNSVAISSTRTLEIEPRAGIQAPPVAVTRLAAGAAPRTAEWLPSPAGKEPHPGAGQAPVRVSGLAWSPPAATPPICRCRSVDPYN